MKPRKKDPANPYFISDRIPCADKKQKCAIRMVKIIKPFNIRIRSFKVVNLYPHTLREIEEVDILPENFNHHNIKKEFAKQYSLPEDENSEGSPFIWTKTRCSGHNCICRPDRPLKLHPIEDSQNVTITVPLDWIWISKKPLADLVDLGQFENIDNLWPDEVREKLPDHVELVGENPTPPYEGEIHRLLKAEMEIFVNMYDCDASCSNKFL